jgi:hypothetical protein
LNPEDQAASQAVSKQAGSEQAVSEQPVSDVTGSVQVPAVSPAPGGNPALLRIDAPAAAGASPFSCLQLRIIDEVELIADAGCD